MYKIIWDKNRLILEERINTEMKTGWGLQGGLALTTMTVSDKEDGRPVDIIVFGQALTKEQ